MTLVVAITGGIGSGKSTFSKEVLKRKIQLLDSDEQVSRIYNKPKKNFLNYLKKIGLGNSVNKKKINKQMIRDKIFSERIKKSHLESFIFKIVRK